MDRAVCVPSFMPLHVFNVNLTFSFRIHRGIWCSFNNCQYRISKSLVNLFKLQFIISSSLFWSLCVNLSVYLPILHFLACYISKNGCSANLFWLRNNNFEIWPTELVSTSRIVLHTKPNCHAKFGACTLNLNGFKLYFFNYYAYFRFERK